MVYYEGLGQTIALSRGTYTPGVIGTGTSGASAIPGIGPTDIVLRTAVPTTVVAPTITRAPTTPVIRVPTTPILPFRPPMIPASAIPVLKPVPIPVVKPVLPKPPAPTLVTGAPMVSKLVPETVSGDQNGLVTLQKLPILPILIGLGALLLLTRKGR